MFDCIDREKWCYLVVARDHFVAQTYLKHWADPQSGMLRGYGKRSGKEFPCASRDICHEWDWDVNPYFKENPRLLGDYRKIFEPQWNPALAAVRAERMSSEDKFVISGYWALLTICTPTWHRNAVDVADRQLADFIPLVARHLANEKPEYCDFVEEALAKGWIKPNPVPLSAPARQLVASLPNDSKLLFPGQGGQRRTCQPPGNSTPR